MARKSMEVVQVGLRIREDLRNLLMKAAADNEVSLNHEIITRLKASFELKSLQQLSDEMRLTWKRLERAKTYAPEVKIKKAAPTPEQIRESDDD